MNQVLLKRRMGKMCTTKILALGGEFKLIEAQPETSSSTRGSDETSPPISIVGRARLQGGSESPDLL